MSEEQKKDESVGAIWIKQTSKGDDYLSIQIGDKGYVAFKQRERRTDKSPHYKIMERKQRDQASG